MTVGVTYFLSAEAKFQYFNDNISMSNFPPHSSPFLKSFEAVTQCVSFINYDYPSLDLKFSPPLS